MVDSPIFRDLHLMMMIKPDPLRSNYMPLEHTFNHMYCHDYGTCVEEYCTLHQRSNHGMRKYPQHWRGDRGIMERICDHGVGHPDPDEYRVLNGLDDGIHGCDGCCQDGTDEDYINYIHQHRIDQYEKMRALREREAEVMKEAELRLCQHKWRNEFSNTHLITHIVCTICDLEIKRQDLDSIMPNIDVSNIDNTLNGIPRKLLQEVEELLKEFWHAQPGWGDAAVEGYYAEKIINLIKGKQ